MGASTITAFDALTPVPELSILELAVVIVVVRRPLIEAAAIAAEVGRWFKVDLLASDIAQPVRRLQHREWLSTEGEGFSATEDARVKAETAARGIIHLVFRDRFFFDVAKLLDVTIIRGDRGHAN